MLIVFLGLIQFSPADTFSLHVKLNIMHIFLIEGLRTLQKGVFTQTWMHDYTTFNLSKPGPATALLLTSITSKSPNWWKQGQGTPCAAAVMRWLHFSSHLSQGKQASHARVWSQQMEGWGWFQSFREMQRLCLPFQKDCKLFKQFPRDLPKTLYKPQAHIPCLAASK